MLDRKIRIVYGEEDLSSALGATARLILEYGLKEGLFQAQKDSGRSRNDRKAD